MCKREKQMIMATIRMIADSGNIDEVIEILSSVKRQTEGKSDCISCLIHQEVNSENHITYKEIWENQEQLNKHIRSNLYQKILITIDMSSQAPVIQFFTISHIAGIELIETALE